jgi:hypothetical protein
MAGASAGVGLVARGGGNVPERRALIVFGEEKSS